MTEATTHAHVQQFATKAGLLDFLYERVDVAHASDSELQYLARFSQSIEDMASTLGQLTEGVGCLIANDRHEQSLNASGLPGDVQANVLFYIAAELRLIGQIARIASDSGFMLQQRLLDRLKVERSRRGQPDEYSSREGA